MDSGVVDYRSWAKDDWSKVDLGDIRLNYRAMEIGEDFFRNPFVSPPKMLKSRKKLKGFYRFMDSDKVSHHALTEHHMAQTRKNMERHNTILAVHDFTTMAYDRNYSLEGTYDVGNIQGFVVLNSLAVIPLENYGVVEGLLNQVILHRKPKSARTKEDCESRAWKESIRSLNKPQNTILIDVMDRGADALEIMHCSKAQNHEFIIRAKQNRYIKHEHHRYLFEFARELPARGSITLKVNKTDAKKHRLATLQVAYSKVTLDTPKNNPSIPPIACSIIHVIEANPPKDEEPIEWFLLTSLSAGSLDAALRIIRYYSYRWIIEEYHKCLKTGFRLEKTQLQTLPRIENLLAFISVSSIKLLQLRDIVRRDPQADAKKYVESNDIQIIKQLCEIKEASMTIDTFLRSIAQLGGFLNRKSDGNPGWQSIWEGWKYFMTFKEGFEFHKKFGRCG